MVALAPFKGARFTHSYNCIVMKPLILAGMVLSCCSLSSFGNLIGTDVTGDLSGVGFFGDVYGVSGTATVGSGIEFTAVGDLLGTPTDGLLTLDLQGVGGHDVLVSFLAPSSPGGPDVIASFSLAALTWGGGGGTVTGFSLVQTSGGAVPLSSTFSPGSVGGDVQFLGSGSALFRITATGEEGSRVPEGGATFSLLVLGLLGLRMGTGGRGLTR